MWFDICMHYVQLGWGWLECNCWDCVHLIIYNDYRLRGNWDTFRHLYLVCGIILIRRSLVFPFFPILRIVFSIKYLAIPTLGAWHPLTPFSV